MQTHLRSGLFGVCALLCGAAASHADTVDLTAQLRAEGKGTYTYYALGNSLFEAVDPFSVKFYPGMSTGSLQEPGHPGSATGGAAISFATGKLLNGLNNHSVGNWRDVVGPVAGGGGASENHAGRFLVLFDLEDVYNLSDVTITYTNASGERWDSNFTQNVYTATEFTGNMSDFVLLGDQLFSTNGSNIISTAEYEAVAGGIHARYVLLELTASMSAIGTNNAVGGKLIGVSITGDPSPVPEPAAVAALMAASAGTCLWLRRRSNRRASTSR